MALVKLVVIIDGSAVGPWLAVEAAVHVSAGFFHVIGPITLKLPVTRYRCLC
jgi:hypothetical protein